MRYLLFMLSLAISHGMLAQEILSPLRFNPYQNKTEKFEVRNDKSSKVSDHIIYQFDTLKLPFKDDFSSNRFPTPDADTSNASKITMFLLLRNGTPAGMSETFSVDTSFIFRVFPASNDSLSSPSPNSSEQITFVDMSVFPFVPIDTTVWPPYTIYDTIGRGSDTIYFQKPDLVQKEVTKYILPPDPNILWTDYYVYRNNNFPSDPPSIGVVTFDGLDERGQPYEFDANVTGDADRMTSAPIDLSQLSSSDSLYLSFYFQPQGLSFDAPDHGDSLVLYFYNKSADLWEKVWGVNGGILNRPFENVMILVDNRFLSNAFQLRFKNRANLSGSFDQWHLDYLILDKNRSKSDTIHKDITFVYDAPSFIKNYTSMPWFHYKLNPKSFNKDEVEVCFKNRYDESLSAFYGVQLINTNDHFQYYRYPSSGIFAIVNQATSRCQHFDIERGPTEFSTHLRANDFNQEEIIEAKYSIDFRPASSEKKDFFPTNDTLRKLQVFGNYYAYDDGTAEAGYGVEGYPGNIMLNYFQMPIDDSLVGLNICFLPQAYDISKHKFKIVVYNSLNNGGLMYESTVELEPKYTAQGEFAMYALDSLLPVNQDIYVGVKALGNKSLNIGYDFNTENKANIFRRYSENDPFTNPSAVVTEGSLMMRPVFRKLDPKVGIEKQVDPFSEVKLYPNPSKGKFFIENLPKGSMIKVYDGIGKLILMEIDAQLIDLREMNPGIYFVQMSTKKVQTVHTRKIIISAH